MRNVLAVLLLVGLSSAVLGDLYSDTVEADNPVAYWKFEETGGTTAADQTGAHPATYTGYPTLGVNGANGKAVYLPGTNYWYPSTSGTASLLPGSASFTTEAWIKTGTTDTQRVFSWMGSQTDGSNRGVYSIYYHLGDVFLEVRGSSTLAVSKVQATANLADDAWHQIVGVYDRGNDQILLYIDGGLAASAGSLSLGDINSGSAPAKFCLGAYAAGTQTINGTLDEVSFYHSALSADRIAAHYNAIPEPATMGLLVSGAVAGLIRRRK